MKNWDIGLMALAGVMVSAALMIFFGSSEKPSQQAQQPHHVYQTPVDNIQFSKIIDAYRGYRHIYIDDQLGVVCIKEFYRLACVPQKDINPEGLAELRAQAKSQAAAKNAAAEKAGTSH